MDASTTAGPDPDTITSYITQTYPETVIARAMNATFFSLDDSHWPNFATIVTTDEHDDASNLSRPGIFRLNIGTLSRETFARLVEGADPQDFTVLDQVIPIRSTPDSDGSRSSTRAIARSRRSSSRSSPRPTIAWPPSAK